MAPLAVLYAWDIMREVLCDHYKSDKMQGILVVTQSDPMAQDVMLELLLPRLRQLFDADQARPPLKLDACMSGQVCCFGMSVAT